MALLPELETRIPENLGSFTQGTTRTTNPVTRLAGDPFEPMFNVDSFVAPDDTPPATTTIDADTTGSTKVVRPGAQEIDTHQVTTTTEFNSGTTEAEILDRLRNDPDFQSHLTDEQRQESIARQEQLVEAERLRAEEALRSQSGPTEAEEERYNRIIAKHTEAVRAEARFANLNDEQVDELARLRISVSQARTDGDPRHIEATQARYNEAAARLIAEAAGQQSGEERTPRGPRGSTVNADGSVTDADGNVIGQIIDGEYVAAGSNQTPPPHVSANPNQPAPPPVVTPPPNITDPNPPDPTTDPSIVTGPVTTLGQSGQNPLTQTTMDGPDWQGNRPEFLGEMPATMPGATHYNIAPENLVEGRMASLMDSDNPVFQSLREITQRAHAARGGQNSLMASQAATVAMANMAFQIGSADAQLLARSAEFNAAMSNQFGLAQQQFMFNALLSDQNYGQAMSITQAQISGALAEARIRVAGMLGVANINAETSLTLAGMQIEHDVNMLGLNHTNELEILDVTFGQTIFRDTHLADLDLRNRYTLSEQDYGHDIGRMGYEAELVDWLADGDFQRTWALNFQQNRVNIAGSIIDGIFNMGIQPGMTTAAIAARVNDVFGIVNQFGLLNTGVYLNGADPNNNYAVFPPPGG